MEGVTCVCKTEQLKRLEEETEELLALVHALVLPVSGLAIIPSCCQKTLSWISHQFHVHWIFAD